ncbi:hypothetical protein ACTXT7_008423 [Hymenolepis weldensis]
MDRSKNHCDLTSYRIRICPKPTELRLRKRNRQTRYSSIALLRVTEFYPSPPFQAGSWSE